MTLVDVQPAAGTVTAGAPMGGWQYVIPNSPAIEDIANGITPIKGLRSSCSDLLGDSPPIGREVYLVTGLRVVYGTIYNTNVGGGYGEPWTLLTEIALLKSGDILFSQVDEQTAMIVTGSGVDATYVASGTITADLVNPIAVYPGEQLQLRIGSLANGDTEEIDWIVAAQTQGPYPGFSIVPSVSTITYQSAQGKAA